MNPRLRVPLAIAGVTILVAFVLIQVYFVVIAPLLAWRGERTADRVVYESIARLRSRAEIERTLSGWKAEPQEAARFCAQLVKRRVPGTSSDTCKTADHEVIYQRRRPMERDAPLTPLRIIVVYDRGERALATTTLD